MKTFYKNGAFYTANPDQYFAEAMLVEDGKISWIGNEDDARQAEFDVIIDLQGKRVLPGIIDAHMHPLLLAEVGQKIYCGVPQVHSIKDIQHAIKMELSARANEGEEKWVLGWGYDESKLVEGRSPSKEDLDEVTSSIPIVLTRACGHIVVANSAALKLADITSSTKAPYGGEIEVDETGELTGVLKEKARELVYQAIPEQTLEEKGQLLAELSKKLFSQGITAITELMATLHPYDFYEIYEKAYEQGYKQHTVMYYLWDDIQHKQNLLKRNQSGTNEDLQIGGIKLFADGSISGKTAWFSEGYVNDAGNTGISVTSPKELLEAAAVAKEHQLQVVVHGMGDRAIRQVVGTFAEVDGWLSNIPSVRIEHAALIDQETLVKGINAGIGFVTQPIFLFAEIDSYLNNLGASKTNQTYRIKTMLDSGANICLSSDAPATSWEDTSNPFIGIKSAVTRTAYSGKMYNPSEAIPVQKAIDLYTRHAQEMTGIPLVGKLKTGNWADFIVLEDDILTANSMDIDKISVLATYFKGDCVFEMDKKIEV